MTTAIYLIISGILIGAGISIVWRDIQRKRRGAFVSARDVRVTSDPDIEITIDHGGEPEPIPRVLPVPSRPPPRYSEGGRQSAPAASGRGDGQSLAAALAAVPSPPPVTPGAWDGAEGSAAYASPAPPPPAVAARAVADPPRQGARLALEQQWSALQPAVAAGIERTNVQLGPVRLAIGPVGEPTWSYKNRAYGAYRRVLIGGESVAWLRLELFTDGRLRAAVKAHRDDKATLNATTDAAAADVDGDRAAELFSECLQPAATYAARKLRDADEVASEMAWESVDALVAAALKATNGALAQAGAKLASMGPAAWEGTLRRHRMALSVEVNGDDVARMHIERLPHEMEVAVGVRDPQLAALARRRRIPVDGMTIHALAEMIASCAWPAIARFREHRRQA
jgi:hypothetical protein